MNRGDQNIRIPFVSASLPDVKSKDYIDLLKAIKEGAVSKLRVNIDSAAMALREGEDYEEVPAEASRATSAPPPPAPPAADPYAGKTNQELKEMLKARGLKQSGNSEELRARLIRGTN